MALGVYFKETIEALEDPNLCYHGDEPSPMLESWEQGWKDSVIELSGQVEAKLN